jgi:hypothetical protein
MDSARPTYLHPVVAAFAASTVCGLAPQIMADVRQWSGAGAALLVAAWLLGRVLSPKLAWIHHLARACLPTVLAVFVAALAWGWVS